MQQAFDILVIYPEAIRKTLAGTGIRALELARSLARAGFRVGLTSTSIPNDREDADVCVFDTTKTELLGCASRSKLVIVQGFALNSVPELCRIDVPIAIDLICPMLLETLDGLSSSTSTFDITERTLRILSATRISLLRGDYFFCGNERQVDWWLGHLAILGRLNHLTYNTILDRFAIVPFGIPLTPPTRAQSSLLREYLAEDLSESVVFFWGGGIWPWFDIQTVIQGFIKASAKSNSIKLLIPPLQPTVERGLATGHVDWLKGVLAEYRHIIRQFKEWIPYDLRGHVLAEVDVGISCHPSSLESRFAVRTRYWDYLWARLPMIVSNGDIFSSWIHQARLGITVPPGDSVGWCNAILEMTSPSTRKHFSQNIEQIAPTLTWDRVANPLIQFASNPSRLRDGVIPNKLNVPKNWKSGGHSKRKGWALIRYGIWVLFRYGPKQFLRGLLERFKTINS